MQLALQPLFVLFHDRAFFAISMLSLHDALPISACSGNVPRRCTAADACRPAAARADPRPRFLRHSLERGEESRSEEHTSELQSRVDLVCRLLLEKKNRIT